MSEELVIVENAGIVAGGATELTVLGVTYSGTAYDSYESASQYKNVVAAEDISFSSEITIAGGHTTALKDSSFSGLTPTASEAGSSAAI